MGRRKETPAHKSKKSILRNAGVDLVAPGQDPALHVADVLEARAKADLAEAKANLDRATGSTIQAQNINLAF